MHVAPADLRSARIGDVTIRFAILGDVAYALADLPGRPEPVPSEDGCEREHWAVVVDGSLELEVGTRRESIPSGTAFHVGKGVPHAMIAPVGTRLAGFATIEPGADLSDETLRGKGVEIVRGRIADTGKSTVPVVAAPDHRRPEARQILASVHAMGDLLFTRAVLGRRSGYTSSWCDAPHWGIVVRGDVVVDGEHDVEIVTAGDVYLIEEGPPGHRIQSAEGATIIDFTPLAALRTGMRTAEWRHELAREIRRRKRNGNGIAIAPLG